MRIFFQANLLCKKINYVLKRWCQDHWFWMSSFSFYMLLYQTIILFFLKIHVVALFQADHSQCCSQDQTIRDQDQDQIPWDQDQDQDQTPRDREQRSEIKTSNVQDQDQDRHLLNDSNFVVNNTCSKEMLHLLCYSVWSIYWLVVTHCNWSVIGFLNCWINWRNNVINHIWSASFITLTHAQCFTQNMSQNI